MCAPKDGVGEASPGGARTTCTGRELGSHVAGVAMRRDRDTVGLRTSPGGGRGWRVVVGSLQ
jgi:hypothetical protein